MRHVLLVCLAAAVFPVCPGSARAALPSYFQQQTITSGFLRATGFAFLPDGRAFIVEKAGDVLLMNADGSSVATILTVPNVHTIGEAGLVGVTVDPGWPARPFVYVFYNADPIQEIRIVRYTASGDLVLATSTGITLSAPFVVLTIPETDKNHNGGTLRFGPDDMLYASIGEDTQLCTAQDTTNLNGTVIRLDVSALPDTGAGPADRSLLAPPDNPFAADTTDAKLVFCYGLRNPFRFTIDPVTGNVYIGDVGNALSDEVDESSGGENFGWPIWEGDSLTGFNCGPVSEVTPPIVGYHHPPPPWGDVLTGGPRYRETGGQYRFPPEYDGVLFYAEHYKGWIRVIRQNGPVWESLSVPGQPNPEDWGAGLGRIVDFDTGPGDALYLLKFTDDMTGSLSRIVYTGPSTGVPETVLSLPLVSENPYRTSSGALRLAFKRSPVNLFDLRGRLIRTIDKRVWDGSDDRGRQLSPGIYFLNDGRETHKLTIVP